tara:strand:+ start:75 stop:656 length:582 start_codon:yes stop_codon:yes gene_type:complete
MNKLEEALKRDPQWKILNQTNENWEQDPLFSNYHKLSTKNKGMLGEYALQRYMEQRGHNVQPAQNLGHDRIIDSIKTEIKTSLATSRGDWIDKDKFIANHVSKEKDWDRLIWFGVNPMPEWGNMKIRKNDKLEWERFRIVFMEKQDFINYMNSSGSKLFKPQQGGKAIENDDYMCTNFLKFLQLPFVRNISEW